MEEWLLATYPHADWIDDGAAARLLGAWVRRRRAEGLLMAAALGNGQRRTETGGGLDTMMAWLG